MNYKMLRYMPFWVVKLEGVLLILPVFAALIYGEAKTAWIYFATAVFLTAAGILFTIKKPEDAEIYRRDGCVIVALGWIIFCLLGAVPFVLTGDIPSYINAFFETVSGCTTTGASILPDVEALSHAGLFWRSLTHWIGGMGVLVFLLILVPVKNGSQMNLMKAESPGPDVSKFVPRFRDTAALLYKIYIIMTAAQAIILLITGMAPFDALCITFGTAGTGGFAVLNSGVAAYTPLQQWIIAVFMMLFGVNFMFYYLLLIRKGRVAVKMEEVKAYFIIIAAATAGIAFCIRGSFDTAEETLRHSFFQVTSIMTTTGFASTDFNLWPSFAKMILMLLMFIGACAGSTGGGIKVSRIMLTVKAVNREAYSMIHPRSIRRIRMNGHAIDNEMVRSVLTYLSTYVIIFALSLLIISLNGFSFETTFSAVSAAINNIGPGFDAVGPMSNFNAFSPLSKIVLIFDMIAGRLELYPVLILLSPGTWKR